MIAERRNYELKTVIAPHSFTVSGPLVSPRHWQSEMEAVYVESGWLELEAGEGYYHVDAGEMIFINGGVIHRFVKKDERAVIYVIKFSKEYLVNDYFTKEGKEAILGLLEQIFMVRKDEYVSRAVNELMFNNMSSIRSLSDCFMSSRLIDLTVYLIKNPKLVFNAAKSELIDSSKVLCQTIRYINEHAIDKISLNMVADYLGFSACYCSKYIKKKTGMSFIEYVNTVRVGKAETLLLNTTESITDIAFETGFSSMQSFNRVFKQINHMSPSSYRKMVRIR